MYYTLYKVDTGRIRGGGHMPEKGVDAMLWADASLRAIKGEWIKGNAQYIDVSTLQPVPRPELGFDKTEIVADDTDVATLTGLPDPCVVRIDGTAHTITGGTLQISSPLPATYHVEITDENAFPAQALDVEIVAT